MGDLAVSTWGKTFFRVSVKGGINSESHLCEGNVFIPQEKRSFAAKFWGCFKREIWGKIYSGGGGDQEVLLYRRGPLLWGKGDCAGY